MNRIAKKTLETTGFCTVLALAALMLLGTGIAGAQTIQYLDDGAVQNSRGGFDLPLQGYCWGDGAIDTAHATRPLCIALRMNYAKDPCTAGTAPTVRSWSTGVCNDLINTTQLACEAQPDRLWTGAPVNKCAIVMNDDDRNDVVCALHQGTWVTSGTCVGTWVMPPGSAYASNLLTWNGSATSAPGPGDQCLRCHNTRTQYNGPRVRDTEDTMFMGHKNMSRPVVVGMPWGGPDFHCIDTTTGLPAPATSEEACYDLGFNFNWVPLAPYPGNDVGQDFHWDTGQIDLDVTAGTNLKDLLWIYADWLSPLPRAIYADAPDTSVSPNKPTVSYSCSRCHTTGWTADATVNYGAGGAGTSTREPEKSLPGVTWDGVADATFGQVNLAAGAPYSQKSASWDAWGITCTRCHNSAINRTSTAAFGFSAPTGMSSHHNALTAADNSSGVCTKTQWTAETQCTADGGLWLTNCSVNPTAAVCTQAITTSGACTSPGVWVGAPGWCSNAFYSTSPTCTANGFNWQDGWCSRPDKTTSTDCAPASASVTSLSRTGGVATAVVTLGHPFATSDKVAVAGASPSAYNGTFTITVVDSTTFTYPVAAGTDTATGTITAALGSTSARNWRLNGNQASCQVAGATWSYSSCSLEGVCNDPSNLTSKSACTGVGGQFAYATDVIRCEDAGGHWTGSNSNRGQIITSLCMNCHRQEASGVPVDATNPATALKVGPYHSSVGFVSHPHANQFLNSPHGKFTGTFAQIPTGKFNYAMTGEYKSFFMTEGEAGNTGNGCTGCHDVHTSTVTGEKPFAEECTECHAKDLTNMIHSAGPGTPLEDMATDPMEACVICHMPAGEHLFRINTDAAYSTKPATALTATVNANTAPDGIYPSAVWVDLDSACGKCHGGGVANVETTGRIDLKFWDEDPITSNLSCAEAGGTWVVNKCTVPAGSSAACAAAFGTWNSSTSVCTLTAGRYLRVPDGIGATMTANQRLTVAGAGALYYQGINKLYGDFETYIASTVRAPWITLAGPATKGVIGAAVAQNPVKNHAAYFSKATLAVKAAGIHNDKPYATFGYSLQPGNTLQVNVNASFSTCSGSIANCDAFVWNWGDGTPNSTTSTPTTSHIYATAGTKLVTLTVEEYGVNEASVSKNVRVFAVDAPPVAGGTACGSIVNPNSWVATLVDGSVDPPHRPAPRARVSGR